MSTDSGSEKLEGAAQQSVGRVGRRPQSGDSLSTKASGDFRMLDPADLVAAHQGMVISIADSIYRRVPRHISKEDLVAYGQVGLLQAARSFRPQPGVEFGTYAYYRISGAIYDGLTRMNWTSRSEYRRSKADAAAHEVLQQSAEGQGERTAEENAQWLDGSVKQLTAVFLLSQLPDREEQDDDPMDPGQGPFQAAVGSELQERVRQSLADLPDEAQQFIRWVYFEDFSLAQAGERMGRSRSWACRFHSAVLEKLAIRLTGADA